MSLVLAALKMHDTSRQDTGLPHPPELHLDKGNIRQVKKGHSRNHTCQDFSVIVALKIQDLSSFNALHTFLLSVLFAFFTTSLVVSLQMKNAASEKLTGRWHGIVDWNLVSRTSCTVLPNSSVRTAQCVILGLEEPTGG